MNKNTFYQKLLNLSNQNVSSTIANRKLTQVMTIIDELEHHQLPKTPAPQIEFTPYQLINNPNLYEIETILADFRQYLITTFGIWFLPHEQWLSDVARFIAGRRTLEIMAGNGIISYGLRQLDVPILATDNFNWQNQDIETPQPWTEVVPMSAIEALQTLSYDVVIMSWAPDTDNSDVEILNYLREQKFTGDFIVIGEKNGVTNSSSFWQLANLSTPTVLNKHHHSFDNINDQIFLAQ